jgi:DNA-directed RNA polymerase subunit RPC12/RpoP
MPKLLKLLQDVSFGVGGEVCCDCGSEFEVSPYQNDVNGGVRCPSCGLNIYVTATAEAYDENNRWVLACVDRTRSSDLIVWWAPDERGYTTDFDRAGRYTLERALEICRRTRTATGEVKHLMFTVDQIMLSESKKTVVDRARFNFMQQVREESEREDT